MDMTGTGQRVRDGILPASQHDPRKRGRGIGVTRGRWRETEKNPIQAQGGLGRLS